MIVTDPPPHGQRTNMPLASFTFLLGDGSVNMLALGFLSLYAKYAGIFEKQTPDTAIMVDIHIDRFIG